MLRSRRNRKAPRHPLRTTLWGLALTLAALSAWAGAQSVAAETGRFLAQGNAAAAAALLEQRLSTDPNDAEARFALGAVQALRSVERLAQDAYRFGLGSGSAGEIGLIFGIEVATNPSPDAVAYDAQDLWDATAQLFFARAETPFPYLGEASSTDFNDFDVATLVDVVALIHLLDLPLREPDRLARSLAHLETTVALSRASWGAILAETDNDREWLPNPRQDSVIPSRGGGPPLAVSDGMVDRWFVLLDELEAILAGRKLVPYWRVGDGRGINVRRVFLEPQGFDLLLWIQGAAVAPYLEAGELTQGDTWRDIVTAFGGQFGMFAFWFN